MGGLAWKSFRNYMNNGGWVKGVRAMQGLGESTSVGSHMIINAADTLNQHLSTIPGALKIMANKTIRENIAKENNDNAIKTALGEDASGLTKDQQLNKLMTRLTTNAGASKQDDYNQIFQDHPDVAKQVEAQRQKVAEYLVSQLPKDPSGHMPFSHDDKFDASKMTSAQKQDFSKIVAVANNPMHLLEEMKNGTLSSKQVATASALNPEILRLMRQAVIDEGYHKNHDLSYSQKLQVSILLGQNIISSLNNVKQLQSDYSSPPVSPMPRGGGKKATGSFKSVNNFKLPTDSMINLGGNK